MGYIQGGPVTSKLKEDNKIGVMYDLKTIPKPKIKLTVREELRISHIIGREIHCVNEEQADLLFEFLRNSGYVWPKNRVISAKNTNWERYKDRTLYIITVSKEMYCMNMDNYRNSSTIIEFDMLCKATVIESIPEPVSIPEILGKLGLVEGEKFDIEGYNTLNPFILRVVDNKLRLLNMYGESIPETLEYILESPKSIIKKTYYTSIQRKAFKALREVFLLNYIVRDSDGQIWGLVEKPKKTMKSWMYSLNEKPVCLNRVAGLEFIKWIDEEPFKIP